VETKPRNPARGKIAFIQENLDHGWGQIKRDSDMVNITFFPLGPIVQLPIPQFIEFAADMQRLAINLAPPA